MFDTMAVLLLLLAVLLPLPPDASELEMPTASYPPWLSGPKDNW